MSRAFLVRGGGEAIVDRAQFRRESLLALAQSTVKVSSLGETDAQGRKAAPPIANLTDGPAALADGEEAEPAARRLEGESAVAGRGSPGGGAGGLSAQWAGDDATALVREHGWLPGSVGAQLAAMRREAEEGVARTYVFGSELLEQHHDELLAGMRIPRQLEGFLALEAPLLTNLAMGAPGSGVYFHRHDSAFSAVFYGAKRWMLYPGLPTAEEGTGADAEHYKWATVGFLDPALNSSRSFVEERLEGVREEFDIDVCTQHAGDLFFVPGGWHHSTLNLAETVGVAWREQLMDSSTLDIAALKWAALRRAGGAVRVEAANEDAAEASMVFDQWVSEQELVEAGREERARAEVEQREAAEAAVPSRGELLRRLEARRQKGAGG